MKYSKVLTFGTFDIFHKGHEFFLKKAKQYGSILGIVVARDKTVKKIKGKLPRNNELKRKAVIQNLDYVNKIFLGGLKDKYLVIEKFKPDIICLGYDQNVKISDLNKILKEKGLKIKIIKFRKGFKPDLYKSSKISKTS